MKPANLPSLLGLTSLLLSPLLPLSAAPATAVDPGVSRLDPVVVQDSLIPNLQLAPLAGTHLGEETIRRSGLESLQSLPTYVPNLALSSAGGRSFGDNLSLRGLTNTSFFSDPSVAVYVDDAPLGDVFTFVPELYEIESIEVLRGSQATLFGRNSEAGVIAITTRKPTNVPTGEASLTYADHGEEQYRASVMGPLVKGQLYYGISGGHAVRDGLLSNSFRGNDPDQRRGWDGRVFLRWTPSREWTINLDATASSSRDGEPRTQSLTAREYSVDSDVAGRLATDHNAQSLRISHAAPDCIITSITTRREWTMDPLFFDLDLTRFPAPGTGNYALIRQDQEQWSEELRFRSAHTQPWSWVGGLYLASVRNHGDNTRNFFVPQAGFFETQRTLHTLDSENAALFGQASRRFGPRFSVTLGLRADHTHRSLERTKTGVFTPPSTPIDESSDFLNFATTLTVEYRATDAVQVYGLTGSGFKAGGYSAFIDRPASPRFDSEHVWNNEVGVKATSADQRFSASAAAFYYFIWDYQVERALPFSTDYAVYNAPEARSFGAEVEGRARLLEGLELSAAFGCTEVEFRRFRPSPLTPDLGDRRAPFVPAFNAMVAAQYRHASGLFGRVELAAVGRTFYDEENSPLYRENSYTVLHARVGYEGPRGSVHLFVRNLTDDFHFERRIAGLAAGVPGAPLTVGARLALRF